MPIHLIWGDDVAACNQAIEQLIGSIVNPQWKDFNVTRLNGSETNQAKQALEEILTAPFGNGGRMVVLGQSPFCNNCPKELIERFESILEMIPKNNHLVLKNTNKPDGRLKTTKAIQKLINIKQATEKKYILPAIWDHEGLKKLVERTAQELGIQIEKNAISYLVNAIGSDSTRLRSELQKLAIHAETNQIDSNPAKNSILITTKNINALIEGKTTNIFQISNSILEQNISEVITQLDILLDAGEPALRILAGLTSQIRGWLWVSLLEQKGEKDVGVIAKAAGISNPKRIYIMRKQVNRRPPQRFLKLLDQLLEVEVSLKRGIEPKAAFREGLIMNASFGSMH